QLMSLHPSFSLSSSRRHPHTHSFPTRRSSDLCRATRFRAGSCQLYLWHRVLYRDSSRKPVRDPVPSGKEPYRRFAITEKLCGLEDRKSTRLNSSHVKISYAVFCLKKKKNKISI